MRGSPPVRLKYDLNDTNADNGQRDDFSKKRGLTNNPDERSSAAQEDDDGHERAAPFQKSGATAVIPHGDLRVKLHISLGCHGQSFLGFSGGIGLSYDTVSGAFLGSALS